MKFDDFVEGVPFDYGDVYQRVSNANTEWIKIGVSRRQIALLCDLSGALTAPFELTYIATETSQKIAPGRYESIGTIAREELATFFDAYGEAFEQDGRHALWVIASDGLLVFTQHDVIYAYGPLQDYVQILQRRDFAERDFSIPGPHFHFYNGNYDEMIDRMMAGRKWNCYELEPIDEET